LYATQLLTNFLFLVFTNINNTINTAITFTATTTAVYASDGFLALTGYTRQQVVGRNCRFLQGPDTDAATVAKLREGIAAGVDTSVFLRNFNSSGEPFWNHVFVACLKNAAGKVVNYVGIQHKLDKPPLDDILDQFVLPDITTTEDDESSDTLTDNMC
jgi:PAS domain S-box-containing protein